MSDSAFWRLWFERVFLGENTSQVNFQDLIRIFTYSPSKTCNYSVHFLLIWNLLCNVFDVVAISHLSSFCTLSRENEILVSYQNIHRHTHTHRHQCLGSPRHNNILFLKSACIFMVWDLVSSCSSATLIGSASFAPSIYGSQGLSSKTCLLLTLMLGTYFSSQW